MKHHLQGAPLTPHLPQPVRPSPDPVRRRSAPAWFGLLLLVAIPLIAACTADNSPDGWSPPLLTELPDGRQIVLARTSDDRLGALDLTASAIIWQFPDAPRGQLLTDEEPFPGLLEQVDVKGFYGAPVALGRDADEFVIADHDSGIVFAIQRDGTSARILLDTEDRVIAGVVVADDDQSLFIATSDEHVYAIDSDDPPTDLDDRERFLWIADDVGGKVWGTPALAETSAHGTVLLVPTTAGHVVALRVADGTIAWTFKSEAAIASDVVVSDDVAYFGGFDRTFYALEIESGAVRWTATSSNWFWTRALVSGGVVYAGDLDGNVWAWDANGGAPIWETPFDAGQRIRAAPVLTAADQLVIITREGQLTAIDRATGLRIWPEAVTPLQTPNRVLADPLILDDDSILVSDDQGLLWRSRVNRGAICQVFPDRDTACETLLDGEQG